MMDFYKGQGDSAPIPESLFCSLTGLCRSIDEGEIVASNIGNSPPNEETDDEAKWTKVKEYLGVQGEQAVDFDHYQETICQFICCYVQHELVVPNLSLAAPPAPAPTPEPSHGEVSAALTPQLNMTPRALMEGYDS